MHFEPLINVLLLVYAVHRDYCILEQGHASYEGPL